MLAYRKLAALLTAILMVAAACSSTTTSLSAPPASAPPTQITTAEPSATADPSPTPIAVLPGEPWIAYFTIVDGKGLTYLMRPDGADAHQTMVEAAGEVKHPDWSPDGQRLAVNINDDIWVAQADGSDAQMVYSGGCCDFPAWSPDGTKLAFTSYSGEGLGSKPLTSEIRVLDVATKQATTVIAMKRPLLVDVPRWSPDGKELVVGVHQMDDEGFETGAAIAVVPATGGKLRYLTKFDAFAFYPDWSWAMNTIAFDNETIVDQKAPGPTDDTSNLHVIQPDGTGFRQITDVAKGTRVIQPTWAPDGKSIVADFADVWLGVRVDPTTGEVDQFAGCCVSHPRLRPTP
jgi:Tol biopolymer transport system component